jgi:hypothetical protein
MFLTTGNKHWFGCMLRYYVQVEALGTLYKVHVCLLRLKKNDAAGLNKVIFQVQLCFYAFKEKNKSKD